MQVINLKPPIFKVVPTLDSLCPRNFLPGFARASETSHDAAVAIKPKVNYLQGLILDYLSLRFDGATCDELEVALELSHQTASARCRELKQREMVKTMVNPATGKTYRRKTRSGRHAEVLYICSPD